MRKLLPSLAQLGLTASLLVGSHAAFSQNMKATDPQPLPQAALNHLKNNKQALKLSDADIASVQLSSQTVSKNSGVQHLYLQQAYQGIEIHNAVTNMNLAKDGEVLNVGGRFEKDLTKRVKTTKPRLTAAAGVAAAARHLQLSPQALTAQKQVGGASQEVVFSKAGISLEPISAKLVYQPLADGSLRLAWEVSIYELDAQNWWNVRVDASTGEFLEKDNLVTHCEFDNNGPGGLPLREVSTAIGARQPFSFTTAVAAATANVYNVYPLVTESPSHGPRALVGTDAANPKASRNGWNTGLLGVTYTTTQGNNVHAYEDPDNNNNTAGLNYSPDGGAALAFDYPVDFTQPPVTYRDAATTNLFYWNNIMHDVWYQYGFDEQSGNFQADNYTPRLMNGVPVGAADYVRAEAQDSRNVAATRNNANFATPADGQMPRMQMYLWSGIPDKDLFRVTSPAGVAGTYPALEGTFSQKLTPTPVTGKLVVGAAGTGTPEQGCGEFTNAATVSGNIAVVYRGTCSFADKVQNAQKAGAIAVIVINNAPGGPISMGGTPTQATPAIVIPAVMISQADGQRIRTLLDGGTEVAVALKNDGSGPELDGDFDNGIIAHEYGHGISTRLTGGPDNVSCLRNAEQAGEGWSDWFGLMLTTKVGDTGTKVRGIGTYASGQPTTARGIRPAPYSTDFAVNNFTYGATNNVAAISQPHGIGFVWATMIWDLNWALIDKYGYSADLYAGKGGNNLAMQLVIDGLKLQVCSPGFVDSRDAILLADQTNNAGANQELIWKVFARRGLGFSAKQGLSSSRSDQVEAFDLPPVYACSAPTIAVSPANAGFTGAAPKTIYLGYGAQTVTLTASGDPTNTYTWSPAAGLSSASIANPVFTPTKAGSYTFTVTSVNADKCTRTATVRIDVIDVRCGTKNKQVQVCHSGKVLCVGQNEVALHLNHGDRVGTCAAPAAADGLLAGESAASELTLTAAPNPAGARTNLSFTLPQGGAYRLEVLNMQGATVGVVAEGSAKAGEKFSYEFSRNRLATGVYMARLVAGSKSKFTRIVLQD
ncbi:T9SS-dependent M36 family metallopeptidase [uncultured Hymenobacter sp.]|uniref:T9SS-dependent M36 family metallopeptidase n=1 Tax=uncultured Hymenobacter sp. TaxID=170016 RepID=UPI0035CBFEE8